MLLSFSPVDFTASQFRELRESGFAVSRYFVVSKPIEGQSLGDEVKRVVEQARVAEIEEILIAVNFEELGSLPDLLTHLRSAPLPVRLLPDRLIADLATRKVISVGRSIAIELQRPPLTLTERIQKRCLDIVLASLGLLILSPLLLMTVVMVRLGSPGPAIFRQSRRGFNGKPFEIYKFRSMYLHDEGSDVQRAKRGDARITPFGRILRRTSIDKLPQLINVLRGNMSLVGPRPHAVAHDNVQRTCANRQYSDESDHNHANRRDGQKTDELKHVERRDAIECPAELPVARIILLNRRLVLSKHGTPPTTTCSRRIVPFRHESDLLGLSKILMNASIFRSSMPR